ncbi:MAG: hypothetical protein IKZ82_07620, partial [Clostridia bacterium]|nr:hypothetical protein [Clostridia bacterium]
LESLRALIGDNLGRISELVISQLNAAKQRIKLLNSDSMLAKPSLLLDMKRAKLSASNMLLEQKTAEGITAAYLRLEGLDKSLEALSPFSVLKRGYAIVSRKNGQTVGSASELNCGELIALKFSDGTAYASVDEVDINNKKMKM